MKQWATKNLSGLTKAGNVKNHFIKQMKCDFQKHSIINKTKREFCDFCQEYLDWRKPELRNRISGLNKRDNITEHVMVPKEVNMNEFMFNVIDSLFTPYWVQQGIKPVKTLEKAVISVPVNIFQEEDGSSTVEIALPGKTKEDVKLAKKVVDGVNYLVFDLVEKDEEEKSEDDSKRQVLEKRIKVTKHCEFRVPPTQDIDKLEAKMENGLLTITIPVTEAAKPIEFEVK